eukprot:6282329-Alexandrium_andersonii.AAC.1
MFVAVVATRAVLPANLPPLSTLEFAIQEAVFKYLDSSGHPTSDFRSLVVKQLREHANGSRLHWPRNGLKGAPRCSRE